MPSLRDSFHRAGTVPGADAARLQHAIAPRFKFVAPRTFVVEAHQASQDANR